MSTCKINIGDKFIDVGSNNVYEVVNIKGGTVEYLYNGTYDGSSLWCDSISLFQTHLTSGFWKRMLKVGDKVRRISKDVPGYVTVGEEGIVIGLDGSNPLIPSVAVVDFPNAKDFRNNIKFVELIESTTDEEKKSSGLKFNPGDRVKRILTPGASYEHAPVGSLGNVIVFKDNDASYNTYSVKFDNGNVWGCREESLELYVESEEKKQEKAPSTIPSPPPQGTIVAIFCKKKYYGVGNCVCGRCAQGQPLRFN